MLSDLGDRLKAWRREHGLKSFQLAKQLRISVGSYSDIENGKSFPSARTLTAAIEHTDIDVIWLLTGENSADREPGTQVEMFDYRTTANKPIGDMTFRELAALLAFHANIRNSKVVDFTEQNRAAIFKESVHLADQFIINLKSNLKP